MGTVLYASTAVDKIWQPLSPALRILPMMLWMIIASDVFSTTYPIVAMLESPMGWIMVREA